MCVSTSHKRKIMQYTIRSNNTPKELIAVVNSESLHLYCYLSSTGVVNMGLFNVGRSIRIKIFQAYHRLEFFSIEAICVF